MDMNLFMVYCMTWALMRKYVKRKGCKISMLNLGLAKEITIKPNGDGTFNILYKWDYPIDEGKLEKCVGDAECKIYKAKVELNVEILSSEDDKIFELIVNSEKEN